MKAKADKHKILSLLKRGKGVTQASAAAFGCWRLAARIFELREEYGHSAISTTIGHDKMAIYKWEGQTLCNVLCCGKEGS